MQAILRLPFLALSCALILSGVALAAAAYTRNSEALVIALAFFLMIAAGAPLLVARQIGRIFEEQEQAIEDASIFEALTVEQPVTAEPEPFQLIDDPIPEEDGETLRRDQKAQALEHLRDGITHDLNNKLMVISANIDAVARHMKDQPGIQRKLLSALVASDQAAKLIAKSTAFARQSEPQVQYLDLSERISSVAALMGRSLLRDTVELRLSLDEELWPVEADPDDIETAIVTLSAYVRDALEQGGTISLEAQNTAVDKGSLPNLQIQGDFVELRICSISASEGSEDADESTEQTFVLEDMDVTSWLRLNRSLHFLQGIGGASTVSRNGSEMTISMYLPRAQAATMLSFGIASEDDPPSEGERQNVEVLIVDDELEVALALQSTLEEFGYVTCIATDATQAIRNLNARRPGLVLTDVAMPGTMNGVMLAREVRQIFPGLPVLLITGSPVLADEASEFPLLNKPIVSRDLHAAIQRHLKPKDEDNKVVPLFPRSTKRVS
ncbi:response regulator [Microvirga guangxiensis]|uniref:Response regulator receiver domain-containing protein n=1 Tax=Microvirga guangxiensis TaxID=549386 RepID=A0A1G5EDY4_9HYPH|nr:response regulator [Microvirga guangxiensis]SCY25233.1 Response regulator receiver domain-containing protein [Microvirga guangxiensis]